MNRHFSMKVMKALNQLAACCGLLVATSCGDSTVADRQPATDNAQTAAGVADATPGTIRVYRTAEGFKASDCVLDFSKCSLDTTAKLQGEDGTWEIEWQDLLDDRIVMAAQVNPHESGRINRVEIDWNRVYTPSDDMTARTIYFYDNTLLPRHERYIVAGEVSTGDTFAAFYTKVIVKAKASTGLTKTTHCTAGQLLCDVTADSSRTYICSDTPGYSIVAFNSTDTRCFRDYRLSAGAYFFATPNDDTNDHDALMPFRWSTLSDETVNAVGPLSFDAD